MFKGDEGTQEGFTTPNTENENWLSQQGSDTMLQDISAFGRVKVGIASCLTKPVVLKLATVLNKFGNAKRDDLERSENPSDLFVKYVVDMGYITAQGASALIEALKEIHFDGPADEIRALYEKYKKPLEAETGNSEGDSMPSREEPNSEISQTSKRKIDAFFTEEKDVYLDGAAGGSSFEELERGKVAKVTYLSLTDVKAQKSQFVFIQHILHPVFSESDKNKVLCIGTALVISDDVPRPKLLFVSSKSGEKKTRRSETFFKLKSGPNILKNRLYNLSNFYSVTYRTNEGLLIGPETEAAMMSRQSPQFRHFDFKTFESSEPFNSTAPECFDKDICLPVFTVPWVKYSILAGQTIFIISGVIKERIDTHSRYSPRIIFKLIDDINGEFVDVSIFKKDLKTSWLEILKEDESVTLRYFKTYRSEKFQSDTNMLIGTPNSDVEVLLPTQVLCFDKLDELKKFDLGLSKEGVVMTVNPVRPYTACRLCYKKVNEENRCPTCGEVFSEEDLESQFLVKLEIILSESQEIIDGVVFKENVIDALRCYDPNTLTDIDEDVNSLDNLLIDKKVKFVFREREEMNNVFKKFKILGDTD